MQGQSLARHLPAVESGVVYERLDPSILRFVQCVFPAHTCALHYFVGLLTQAHVKQYGLRTDSREVEGDAAIVCARGYQDLRQHLHLAYETTHMYTLIFEALGLVFVQKLKGQLMLIIPLRPYRLPVGLLSTLEQLRERYRSHRPKVGELLETVIERVNDLVEGHDQWSQETQEAFSSELVDTIQQALSDKGVRENSRQVALHIAATIQPFLSVGKVRALPVKEVTRNLLSEDEEDSGVRFAVHEQCAPVLLDRRGTGELPQKNLPALTPRVDSLLGESTRGEISEQEGPGFRDANLPAADQVEEMFSSVDSSTEVLAGTNLPDQVDSAPGNGNGIGNNCNNIFLPVSVNVPLAIDELHMPSVDSPLPHPIVVSQARELALFVEGDEQKDRGAFIKLIRDFSPHIRMAALIATLVRKHYPQGKGALKKPGGYYTQRCKEYRAYGVPDELAGLVGRCIDLPYCEVEEIVKASFKHLASRNRGASLENDESDSLKPKRGVPMDKATADALAVRISQEACYAQVRGVQDVRHAEGIAYVVQLTIGRVDCQMASVEDWEYHHAQVQSLDE